MPKRQSDECVEQPNFDCVWSDKIVSAKMSSSDNIKVAIKVRPLIQRERDQKLQAQWRIQGDTIECLNPVNPNVKFSFGM